MASTSVHFPAEVLAALDRLAAEHGASRNSLIVDACRGLLSRRARVWPPGFFSNGHLSHEELVELQTGEADFIHGVDSGRSNRAAPPF